MVEIYAPKRERFKNCNEPHQIFIIEKLYIIEKYIYILLIDLKGSVYIHNMCVYIVYAHIRCHVV